jgi:leucyl aminopeptidase
MQLDMTGYVGGAEDIVFMNDYTDSNLTSYLTLLLDTYAQSVNYAFSNCGYACSDHASWHNNGYPASMPFEAKMGSHNQSIHSANDTLSKLDQSGEHMLNFAKLATAFAIEMGFAGTPTIPAITPLYHNVPITNLTGASQSQTSFLFSVTEAASSVDISIAGGSGDADLHVKFGSPVSTSVYDCRPYKGGNNESCQFTPQQTGDYYIMLQGYSAYSGVTLSGNYSVSSGNSGSQLNLASNTNQWLYHQLTIPTGTQTLTVSISGGTGDADLYLRKVNQPTKTSYDCRPYKNGNSETCTISNPQAGTWHIGLNAYRTFSGVTLNWQY